VSGDPAGRGQHPRDRWASADAPPAAAEPPTVGAGGADAGIRNRRLDLYA
jgi:hypothetical protein